MEHKLALKDLEIMRLRELVKTLRPKFGTVGSRDIDIAKIQAIFDEALSTPTTYDDLMAWHNEQLGEPVAWTIKDGVTTLFFKSFTEGARPLYAKKG